MTDDLPDAVAAPARGCRDAADDEVVVSLAEDAAFVLGESIWYGLLQSNGSALA